LVQCYIYAFGTFLHIYAQTEFTKEYGVSSKLSAFAHMLINLQSCHVMQTISTSTMTTEKAQ